MAPSKLNPLPGSLSLDGIETVKIRVVVLHVIVAAALFFASFGESILAAPAGILYGAALLRFVVLVRKLRIDLTLAFWAGLGFVNHAFAGSWIGGFHAGALILICLGAAIHYSCLGLMFRRLSRILPSWTVPYCIALLWTSYDFLKTLGFFAYPFLMIGASQADNPVYFALARHGGIWLSGFAALLTGALLEDLVFRARSLRRILPAVCLLIFILAGGLVSWLELGKPQEERSISALFVQQNRDPYQMLAEEGLASLLDLSRSGAAAELVLWPETAVLLPLRPGSALEFDAGLPAPRELQGEQEVLLAQTRALKEYFAKAGPHLFGGVILDEGKVYNAAILYQKDRVIQDSRKRRLAPLSESSLGGGLGAWIDEILLRKPYAWSAGTATGPLLFKDTLISVLLCFEDAFPYLAREMVLQGSDFILTLINGEWAGPGFLEQHARLARFRAIELGKAVYHLGTNGLSTGFAPDGSQTWALEAGVSLAEVLPLTIYRPVKPGLYLKYGDFFPLLCLVVTITMWVFPIFFSRFKRTWEDKFPGLFLR